MNLTQDFTQGQVPVLQFRLSRAYGRERYYPANTAAGVIVQLTGRKCLKDVEISRLQFTGFTIRITEEAQ